MAEGLTAAAALLCQVMLVPGAFGTGTSSLFLSQESYFAEYRAYFEAKGCRVKKAEFPPDATIEERSLILKDQASRFTAGKPEGRLVLVAHSQGALDARFALRTLGMPGVEALISIGAPHSGTPVAQWAVRQRERGSWVYWMLRVIGGYDLRELSFAGEMTPEFLQKFVSRFEPVRGVRYASAQGVCRRDCHRSLKLVSGWIGMDAGDGIVPKHSQAFGDDLGEYDLDHISEVDDDTRKRPERARFLDRVAQYLRL